MKSSFIHASLLAIVAMVWSSQLLADEQFFSPDQQQYINTQLDDAKKVTEDNPDRFSLEVSALVKLVISGKAEKAPQTSDLIHAFFSKGLASQTGVKVRYPGDIFAPNGGDISDIATLHYLATGNTDALFYYTRLSGMSVSSLNRLWSNQQHWNRPELAKYRIFYLIERMSQTVERIYVHGENWSPDSVALLKELGNNFPGNAQVQTFLQEYPFMSGSFLDTSSRTKLFPQVSSEVRRFDQNLVDYLEGIIVPFTGESSASPYMERIGFVYGKKILGDVIDRWIKSTISQRSDPVPKVPEALLNACYTNAFKFGLLDAAQRLRVAFPTFSPSKDELVRLRDEMRRQAEAINEALSK